MADEFGTGSRGGGGDGRESVLGRVREDLTEIVSLLVTGVWLSLLFVGPSGWWLVALIVGYAVVVPLVSILAGEDETNDESTVEQTVPVQSGHSPTTGDRREPSRDNRDALERLRQRYAEGELTDEQFERKVEKLLETETLEDVEDSFTGTGSVTDQASTRERETETE